MLIGSGSDILKAFIKDLVPGEIGAKVKTRIKMESEQERIEELTR